MGSRRFSVDEPSIPNAGAPALWRGDFLSVIDATPPFVFLGVAARSRFPFWHGSRSRAAKGGHARVRARVPFSTFRVAPRIVPVCEYVLRRARARVEAKPGQGPRACTLNAWNWNYRAISRRLDDVRPRHPRERERERERKRTSRFSRSFHRLSRQRRGFLASASSSRQSRWKSPCLPARISRDFYLSFSLSLSLSISSRIFPPWRAAFAILCFIISVSLTGSVLPRQNFRAFIAWLFVFTRWEGVSTRFRWIHQPCWQSCALLARYR